MMVRKLNHYHTFWLNAEHNCRYNKAPFVGDPDDGTIKTWVTRSFWHRDIWQKYKFNFSFDFIWDATSKKSDLDYYQKMQKLAEGFMKYEGEYFYEAKVGFTLLL